MTIQSQPLTLKLSNGQEVSIVEAKSVLRHTENNQQRSCAIVRGPEGAAIYNSEGDVQINGAPSSAHWLQPGDTLEFGDSLSASIEQLGVLDQSIESLVHEHQPTSVAPESPAPAPTAAANDQDTFQPATAAASFIPEPQQVTTPTPVAVDASEDSLVTAAEIAIPVAATSALAAAGILKATV